MRNLQKILALTTDGRSSRAAHTVRPSPTERGGRRLRRILALVLCLVMVLGLMTAAAAATDDTGTAQDTATLRGRYPTGNNTGTTTAPDSYYYWVTDFLDETPTVVRDPHTGETFLKYGLSKVSKIAHLYETYHAAFWLDYNLTMLETRDNANTALWAPIPWRTNFTIGTMLTETTKVLIDKNYAYADAETVLKFLQTRPEYGYTEFLHNDVDYYLTTLNNFRRDVVAGVNQLYPDTARESMTIPELLALAKQYLQPGGVSVRGYLDDVRAAITSLPASNTLLLRDLDQRTFDRLYAEVEWVATRYWQNEWARLTNYALVVPYPYGVNYPW